MYTDKNIVYADAGKYLILGNQVDFQFPVQSNIKESDAIIEDMYLDNQIIYYSNGLLSQRVFPQGTYTDYKRAIVKKRYSNDDQIALMLNKDESAEDYQLYEKMMEWRQFASTVAKKIVEITN